MECIVKRNCHAGLENVETLRPRRNACFFLWLRSGLNPAEINRIVAKMELVLVLQDPKTLWIISNKVFLTQMYAIIA